MKYFWSCTMVYTMIKIKNFFKACLGSFTFSVHAIIAGVQFGLGVRATPLSTALFDFCSGVHQVLLVLLNTIFYGTQSNFLIAFLTPLRIFDEWIDYLYNRP